MTMQNGTAHGPWKIMSTTDVYADPWLKVRKDDVIRPDGAPGTHSVVTIKHGVCVLAYQDDTIYLTKEFHYAVGRITIEAVSGGREEHEPAIECAKRELAEELGISAKTWTELTTVDPFTASVVSPTTMFLATDLVFHETNLEGTEQIECKTMSLADAYTAVCDGSISHTPTCIAILRLWINRAGYLLS